MTLGYLIPIAYNPTGVVVDGNILYVVVCPKLAVIKDTFSKHFILSCFSELVRH